MKTFVQTRCPMCGMYNLVLVNEEDLQRWQCGELAQNAFPYLSVEEREMLISGLCPDCWENLYPDPDEGDYFEDVEDDYIEDDDEGDYEEEIYDLDMGFDPYMGEYTFDC